MPETPNPVIYEKLSTPDFLGLQDHPTLTSFEKKYIGKILRNTKAVEQDLLVWSQRTNEWHSEGTNVLLQTKEQTTKKIEAILYDEEKRRRTFAEVSAEVGNRIIDRKSRIGQTVIAADLLSGDIIGRTLDGKANCLDYSLTMATIGAFHYPRSDVKLVPYNFSFGKGKKENFSTPLTHDHYGFTFFNEDEKVHFAVTFAGEIPLDILMDNTALRQFIDENAVRDPDFYTEEKKREVLYHLYGMRNGIRTAFPDLANVYRNTPEVETEISE